MAVSKTSKTTTAKDTTKGATKAAVQTTLKVEEPKKAETKAEEAAKPAAKTPAKRTTKTAAKRTTTRKTTAKKAAVDVKAELFVQYNGMEYSEKEMMKKVIAAWEAEGKKASAIKRTKLYVKLEDGKAYYVINEGLKNGSTGAIDL